MNTADIVAFLKPTLEAAGFLVVQSALSINAMPEWDKLPTAFVHPVKDVQLGDNRYGTGAFSQPVREAFAVTTVCAIDDLQGWRDVIAAHLHSAHLPGRDYDTEYVEGEILDLNRTAIWWRDVYATQVERSYP